MGTKVAEPKIRQTKNPEGGWFYNFTIGEVDYSLTSWDDVLKTLRERRDDIRTRDDHYGSGTYNGD